MKRFCLIAILSFVSLLTWAQTSSVPQLMNYQGRLTKPDGSPVQDGSYRLFFRIYDQEQGGTKKWEQEMNPVLVRNGVFAVLLGNGNPLNEAVFNSNAYLEVQLDTQNPMTPRQRIVSVAYAIKAESANLANTVKDGAITTPKIASGAVTSGAIADQAITNSKIAPDAGIFSSKIDFSSTAWLNGDPVSHPKFAYGTFNQPTVAGQLVVYTIQFGTSFSHPPTVVITPGNGSNCTCECTVSVQTVNGTSAEIYITDTVTNGGHRIFHWVAIGR